ncbi:hypothetical protein [Actinobacillus equuli]|uniref:hypothetical protein n=1 Tax=Actinobacillus equuli TaxID=718 RepID=UPI00244173BB|nr:hypothetical protein [Actinobacillus equuli]WGE41982.1 EVE domain-containing protein [Actinobacillus equuli subsp. haemolyticus]WGE83115.1 EVE domain-containing protein [Actinobacillus equuli subsp. equuli]
MSNFLSQLQNEYIERNQDKITFSIRLSIKEDLILQEVADAYDLTRQEIIHRLINEHITQSWEKEREKDKTFEVPSSDQLERTSCYYLLNTNSANDIDDHEFMIKNHLAAAFEDGYKEKINRIKKGDFVFLYASGKGIVAFGQADGEVIKSPHYGRENKTFSQKLHNFKILTTPIKAKDIKSILEREFPFAQTLAQISDGEKLLAFIRKLEGKE